VFVRDLVRLLLNAVDHPIGSTTTIVAPDEGITIKALAESIAQAMAYTGPIVFDSTQPEGVLVKRLSSTHFSSQFPTFRFTPLHTGLSETVQWFVSHYVPTADEHRHEPSLCPHT
jgi:nucleoside-diphosphate-sugar epimerase